MFRNFKYDPKPGRFSFEIYDLDIAVINGIRRVILTDIPYTGIDDHLVQIIVSTGPLHSEYLTHRIGLLPICMSEDEIESYEDSTIELELNVRNEGTTMLNVTTADIKGKWADKDLTKKQLEKMFPVNPVTKSHILITRLRGNEQLHFKAGVIKTTADHHSAFSPVSLANFFYMQDPALAAKKDSILDKERSYYTNKYGDANVIQFEIEPINHLIGPKYLVSKALEIIISKLNNLILNITSEDFIKISKFQDLANTMEFSIMNENDTLGNIIQSIVHNKYIREDASLDGIKCSYIGYICPHPLKNELIIRLTLEDQTNPLVFIKFLEANCRSIIDELSNIKREWNSFSK
jgi:DNA-directed RNA polymerase subunit L